MLEHSLKISTIEQVNRYNQQFYYAKHRHFPLIVMFGPPLNSLIMEVITFLMFGQKHGPDKFVEPRTLLSEKQKKLSPAL